MKNISEHISFSEATKSQTAIRLGITNTPNPSELENMIRLANEVFEPCRKHFKKPINVNSFFRCVILNRAIGGSSKSQHTAQYDAAAIDMDGDNTGVSNKELFEFVRDNLLFDQLISEFGTEDSPAWIHVSFKKDGNRRQVLRACKDNLGKTKYIAL